MQLVGAAKHSKSLDVAAATQHCVLASTSRLANVDATANGKG